MFYGLVLVNVANALTTERDVTRWPEMIVPYSFSWGEPSELEVFYEAQIARAIADWEIAGFKFVKLADLASAERGEYRNFISFQSGASCLAQDPGYARKSTRSTYPLYSPNYELNSQALTIQLNPKCTRYFELIWGEQPHVHVAHEIGHRLGFIHEQNRFDAGDYVRIQEDNISSPIAKSQFSPRGTTKGFVLTPENYDYFSIMHYEFWNISEHRLEFCKKEAGKCLFDTYDGLNSVHQDTTPAIVLPFSQKLSVVALDDMHIGMPWYNRKHAIEFTELGWDIVSVGYGLKSKDDFFDAQRNRGHAALDPNLNGVSLSPLDIAGAREFYGAEHKDISDLQAVLVANFCSDDDFENGKCGENFSSNEARLTSHIVNVGPWMASEAEVVHVFDPILKAQFDALNLSDVQTDLENCRKEYRLLSGCSDCDKQDPRPRQKACEVDSANCVSYPHLVCEAREMFAPKIVSTHLSFVHTSAKEKLMYWVYTASKSRDDRPEDNSASRQVGGAFNPLLIFLVVGFAVVQRRNLLKC